MRSKSELSLVGVLVAETMALSYLGCGGGQAPPPPPITVALSPTTTTLQVGSTAQFTATVTNDSANKGVTWSVSCSAAPCGSFAATSTASGTPTTYTASATVSANPMVTITATSAADTTKSATATVTVTLPTLNPTSLNLGLVRLGQSSPPQSATLTSAGNTTLSIGSITITGANPGNFSQKNTCGTSLGAGKSCTITVTFTPTAAVSYSANVSIADNGGGSPQQLSLTGRGKSGAGHALKEHPASVMLRTATVPAPTGSAHVGTRVVDMVDPTRDDPYLANGTPRELLVRFWYPASLSQGCTPAEYTSSRVWSHFSQLLGLPLPEVKTNGCLEAPITEGAHPVVVFTHGYTGTFSDYTFLFEDLASRGYVVASVDHTYEATAVEFPDGRFVTSVLGSHWNDTWRTDKQTLSFAVSVRLDDLRFVVDELERLNAESGGPFAGQLDTARLAIAGHSLGGMSALPAVLEDTRFRAGILIDGWPDSLTTPTQTPVLILAAGREQWSDNERLLWDQLRGPRLAVNLRGAEHLTPSDLVWLAKGAVKTGTMGPDKTIAAVRSYIAEFLDANLRGQALDPLLRGLSSEYPDAVVTTQKESLRGEAADDSAR